MNQQTQIRKSYYQTPTVVPNYKSLLERMMDDEDGILPRAMRTTLGKIVVIGGGVVVLLVVSGALFRVLAYTVGGWKELKRASRD